MIFDWFSNTVIGSKTVSLKELGDRKRSSKSVVDTWLFHYFLSKFTLQWRHNQALIEQKDEARKLDYFLEKTKESLVLNAYFLPDFRWSRAPLSCCNSLAYTDICIRLESIHVLIQICTGKVSKLNISRFITFSTCLKIKIFRAKKNNLTSFFK